MTLTLLALGPFVLYASLLRLKEELRGCIHYSQHLAIVSYIPYPAVVNVCGLSKKKNMPLAIYTCP